MEPHPWGKATGGQWRYALRNSLAMCLALWVAFVLELDEPSWALTSAAVVSFPTVGGVISKSIGRIFGSLMGAAASVAIAGHCLNDPWLFTLFIAAWIGLCTYISNHYQNNVSYAFALAGYTAAIIAFGTVNVTDTQQIFDIAQARVCEVITGILCGGLMMMILPSTSDGEALLTSLRRMQLRLLEHAAMLWQPEITAQMRTSHEGVIGQILTMNLLRIQAFWSHYRLRRQNNLLNYLLHQQLRITSVISSLRRMLLNWPDRPANLMPVLTQLLDELRDPPPTNTVWRACFSRSRRKSLRTTAIAPSGCACAISAGFTCAATAGCSGWRAPRRSAISSRRASPRWRAIPTATKPPTTACAPFVHRDRLRLLDQHAVGRRQRGADAHRHQLRALLLDAFTDQQRQHLAQGGAAALGRLLRSKIRFDDPD